MNFKFHHIGIVVNSIEQYENQMLPAKKIKEVVDEIQNSKLALYENFNDSFIELIEPLNEKSTSINSLKKYGNHLNHLCYKTGSFLELDKFMMMNKWMKAFGPVPAILFENKNVVFYLNRFGQLLEFILSE
jgi:hypothetical protein